MKTIDQKNQQIIIRNIILYFFGFLLLAWVVFGYVLPTYAVLWGKIASINTVNAEFTNEQNVGVNAENYFTIASKYAKVIFTAEDKKNSKEIDSLLKKTDSSLSYKDWVKKELNAKTDIQSELELNDKIISGIIPTYSELSIDNTLFERNRISLSDIVNFVEDNILEKFNLTSFSNVGFSDLSFEKQPTSAVNIGTYKIPLELSGLNKNLLNFIVAIQNSGKLTIQDGKIIPPKNLDSQGFSNLLITIEQMSFSEPMEKADKENKLSVTLVFYVRAKSYSDLLKIREGLANTSKTLMDDVKKYAGYCETTDDTAMCKNENSLKAIHVIRSILDDVTQLNTQLQASLKATTTQDIGAEFSKIAVTTQSLNTLKTTFEKNKAMIDITKKDK